ncbi:MULTISPECIES: hypothetical protein [unclassified Streptomyces]|uniref:hypothetical protein n=1 Tax=unclassified Streptomyces TaxID=2593676 RepID=UPI00211B738B|nr:hypothetical protein [Streptomyces sp. 2R]
MTTDMPPVRDPPCRGILTCSIRPVRRTVRWALVAPASAMPYPAGASTAHTAHHGARNFSRSMAPTSCRSGQLP